MIDLFPHQVEALEQTKGIDHVAYYLDMGLGKTYVGSKKMMSFDENINLVVCQKSKIQDWIDHFKEHYEDVQVLNLTSINGMKPFLSWMNANIKIVGVINYELLWRRKELIEKLNTHKFTLMLDESSLIQNTTAKQTKGILKLNPKEIILLSGTPVGGKYENLWTQIHLLGWKISEDVYNRQYVNWKLTEDDGSGIRHKIVDKENPYKNIERLKSKLREYGAVFKKTEECFELPVQTFQRILVGKPKEYKTFKSDCIVNIDWKHEVFELVGDTTLVKMLYLRQIASQFNQHKYAAFEDLLESTQDRLIVFYCFNTELECLKEICTNHERPVSEVNGHIKDLDAYENESNSITLVQYQAGAKGLNLQKANKIVYFTLPLSSEDFEQSKKRIHRIGQEQPCFYYLLIAGGTIEEDILNTLEQRKDYTDELFRQNPS